MFLDQLLSNFGRLKNLLTSRLAIMNDNNSLRNNKMLDDKIKIFQKLPENKQLDLIKTINKKSSISNYKK